MIKIASIKKMHNLGGRSTTLLCHLGFQISNERRARKLPLSIAMKIINSCALRREGIYGGIRAGKIRVKEGESERGFEMNLTWSGPLPQFSILSR